MRHHCLQLTAAPFYDLRGSRADSQRIFVVGISIFAGSFCCRHVLFAFSLSNSLYSAEKKSDGRSRVDPEADNQQLMLLEEKDVVTSIVTVLSDGCGPGEWMPMEKLHEELMEQYGNVWHHSRVRRYLTTEDWPGLEANGKPWFGLMVLLRKYPEHFVINTRSNGPRMSLEFVSLVSPLS